MDLLVTLRIALRALAKNKMRAGLTILGVVIGIAAVTTMVSVGQSGSTLIQEQFQSLGTNVIVVQPGSSSRGGVRERRNTELTADDAEAISRECPSVLAASAMVGTAGNAIVGNSNWSPKEVIGVGCDYLTVRNWPLRHGGFFTERDIVSAAKVCVIGHTIVARLFQTQDPLNQMIRIRNIPLRVIGVLEKKGANLVGQDQDDIILLPYTTVRKRLEGSNFDDVHAVLVSARSMDVMHDAQQEITNLLMDRHHIGLDEELDFQVQDTAEIAKIFGIVTGIMTAMLSAIAGISLVVGGVGIMNIMLVSVTERTREIGIRMAVGARSGDILRQFLIESIMLSCIGGIIGSALGFGASTSITMIINYVSSGAKWPIIVSLPAAGLALGVSTAVGVFFGYYPARKASRMDPIDALRYE